MKTGATLILERTFVGLDKSALDTLRMVAKRETYPAHTALFRQGEVGDTFYIIVEGRIAVTQRLEDGEERLLAILGPDHSFGEMALIDDTPRMAKCTTLEPTTVLEITEAVFDELVEKNPVVAYTMMRRILTTARENDSRAIADLERKNDALEKAIVALQAAQAELVVKERMEREMELAATVQRSLLPDTLPQFPDYAFAAHLEPARQVGGDFYDVIPLDDAHVGLLIADVADKGFHSALFMAVTRTLFLQEGKRSLSPAQAALAVHRGMLAVASSADVFVTAFYGVLHRPSGRLTYVRAGHDRPLLFRLGQGVGNLTGDGRFLGMWPELTLAEHTVQLQPGDRLLLYSDGVTDAVNMAGGRYGRQRLAETIKSGGHLSAPDLVAHIADAVADFSQGAPSFDDLTLLVVEARD
ncbi:MAG: SpoIIE family protein phosphatase [Chloroflexi bacterium]|nr:SpoIIE family protein phosphatase [Chloroflexota bacterium]